MNYLLHKDIQEEILLSSQLIDIIFNTLILVLQLNLINLFSFSKIEYLHKAKEDAHLKQSDRNSFA